MTRSRMQPRAVSHRSGSNGMARLSQSRSDYHSYRSIRPFIRIHPRYRKSNENPIRAYQKTDVINQNPMKIPPKPIRKQRSSIRIQWQSTRNFTKTKQNPCRTSQKSNQILCRSPSETKPNPCRTSQKSNQVLCRSHQKLNQIHADFNRN